MRSMACALFFLLCGVLPGKGRIEPESLKYLGAFRTPEGRGGEELSWCYSGSAMTYNPHGDPGGAVDGHPGSIFATGHEQFQYVAEISIPAPVISEDKNVSRLPRAEFLQFFTDIREPSWREFEIPRAGLAWAAKTQGFPEDMLFYSCVQHLDEEAFRLSHCACPADLKNKRHLGPWKLKGTRDYLVGDYLFTIPKDWADMHISGMFLASGRFRDGGQASQGPTIFAFSPFVDGKLVAAGKELPTIPLLQYPSIYDDPKVEKGLRNYSNADAWNGAVWAKSPRGGQAVIISGLKGRGRSWYGYRDGTVWPDEPPYPPEPEGPRGWWAERFVPTFMFYDPEDLAKVAKGAMQPHEPQPYAELDISGRVFHLVKDENWMLLGALCFDETRHMLYMFEHNADREQMEPVVHAWQLITEP